jgi:hypothetical protein
MDVSFSERASLIHRICSGDYLGICDAGLHERPQHLKRSADDLDHDQTIRAAIEARHLLQICYQDHYRVVEPNAYGVDPQGRPVLLAYQVSGGGGRDNGIGWRKLDIATMQRVTVLEMTFKGPRPHRGEIGQPFGSVYCHA